MDRQEIGKLGEKLATKFLKKNGYRIIEKNSHHSHNEIDIIAKNKSYIVFVEVKTRKTSDFGYAYEAVDYRKQRKINQGAVAYITANNIKSEIRFDVVEVYGKYTLEGFFVSEINHIENAF